MNLRQLEKDQDIQIMQVAIQKSPLDNILLETEHQIGNAKYGHLVTKLP